MSQRGYILIDVPVYNRFWPNRDLIVRLMEYVRQHLRSICPDVPEKCELELIGGDTAHNLEEMVLLGLYVPQDVPKESIPDWLLLNARVESWCEGLTDSDLRSIAHKTQAPTWDELLAMGSFPAWKSKSGN